MKNVKAGLFLLISQIIYVLITAAWLLFAILTLTMLDQYDTISTVQKTSYIIFMCYPLAFIGAGIASWIFYHKRKFRRAVWVGLIPLLWPLSLFGFFTL
ncbi:hypothetical protein [Paenibacillus harenae]|uniref:hypothetical protein n=1 Tax=Paenibacillus harenae TaxID=306543 RepID=UPI000412347F|nr:hypothetical protein [Paenibacillus harenae]